MLFSVIIPVYKVEKYIFQALESLRTQSFTDWEAIIVDDGSPDASADICREFCNKDSRFKLVHQENAGLSAARNTGMKYAQGEYIYFFDSDDYLKPEFLAEYAKQIKISAPDIVSSGSYIQALEEDNGNIIEKIFSYQDIPATVMHGHCAYAYINSHWLDIPGAPVCFRCYKHSFLKTHRFTFAHGRLHEDEEFTPRAFYCAQTVAFTAYAGYCYRQRKNSIMSTISAKNVEHLVQNVIDISGFFATKKCNTPQMAQTFLYPLAGQLNMWIFHKKYDAEMRTLARKLIIQNKLAKRIRALPMYQYATWGMKIRLFVGEMVCYLPFLRWPIKFAASIAINCAKK